MPIFYICINDKTFVTLSTNIDTYSKLIIDICNRGVQENNIKEITVINIFYLFIYLTYKLDKLKRLCSHNYST